MQLPDQSVGALLRMRKKYIVADMNDLSSFKNSDIKISKLKVCWGLFCPRVSSRDKRQ